MNAYQSQRIRFGILAARHMLERGRLTDSQVDDLEGMELSGWRVHDSHKAFDREYESATERRRTQQRERRADLDRRKVALRKLFGKDCPNA